MCFYHQELEEKTQGGQAATKIIYPRITRIMRIFFKIKNVVSGVLCCLLRIIAGFSCLFFLPQRKKESTEGRRGWNML